MSKQRVIEGTWEEVAQQAAKLVDSSGRVQLILPSSDGENSSLPPKNAAAIAMLEEWLEEDRKATPEEREEAEREWEELKAALEANPFACPVSG